VKKQKSMWTECVVDAARGNRTAFGFYANVAMNAYVFIGVWVLIAPFLMIAWVLDLPKRFKQWRKYRRLALDIRSYN
jgi:hypothetical protein